METTFYVITEGEIEPDKLERKNTVNNLTIMTRAKHKYRHNASHLFRSHKVFTNNTLMKISEPFTEANGKF